MSDLPERFRDGIGVRFGVGVHWEPVFLKIYRKAVISYNQI